MGDRLRLFVTGIAAVGIVGATVAMPSAWDQLFGDDDGPRHTAPLSALRDFDGITLRGPDKVTVTQGDQFAVSVEGDGRDRVNLYVDDGVLHVARRRDGGWGGSTASVRVTMPRLTRIWITGSGDLEAQKLEGPAFRALVTGSGSVNIGDLSAQTVALTLRGSGDMILSGRAGALDVNSFGSGTMNLDGLVARTASIRLVGSGSVDAQASERAALNVAGSGDAHVRGTNVCEVRKTGSGDAACTI